MRGNRPCAASQGIQKGYEVGLLLGAEANAEALVIELDDIGHRGGRAVVEIGRARRQATQDWSFQFADIGAISADHGAANIGHLKSLSRQRPGGAPEREDRQPRDVQGRRALLSGICDTDVQRRLNRMVAGTGRIMAGAAESGNTRQVEQIIQPIHPGDIDRNAVEDLLTAGDGAARRNGTVLTAKIGPGIV